MKIFTSYNSSSSNSSNSETFSDNDVMLVSSYLGPTRLQMAVSDTDLDLFYNEVVHVDSLFTKQAKVQAFHGELTISSIRSYKYVILELVWKAGRHVLGYHWEKKTFQCSLCVDIFRGEHSLQPF